MTRAKKQIIVSGVYERLGMLRVDISTKAGRRLITVGEWSTTAAVTWSQRRKIINQQVAFGLFRWQDHFTPEQWGERSGGVQDGATWGDCAEMMLKEMASAKAQSRDNVAQRLTRWSTLDDRRISELRPHDLKTTYNAAGLPALSFNYQANILSSAKKVLDFAKENQVLAIPDHALLVDKLRSMKPRKVKVKKPSLSIEQADALLRWLRDNAEPVYLDWFELMLFSGVRPGEARALEWGDIDFEAGVIHVRKSRSGKYDTLAPKTDSSIRTVWLAPRARAALRRRAAHGALPGLVFRHPATGRHINCYASASGRNSAASAWYAGLSACNLPRMVPYATRHCYASMMHNGGLEDRLLARQMGHSNTRVLHQVYAEFVEQEDDPSKIDAAYHRALQKSAKLVRTTADSPVN